MGGWKRKGKGRREKEWEGKRIRDRGEGRGGEEEKREGEGEANRRQKKFTAFVLAKGTIMAALLRAQHKQRSGETALIIRPYRQMGEGGEEGSVGGKARVKGGRAGEGGQEREGFVTYSAKEDGSKCNNFHENE